MAGYSRPSTPIFNTRPSLAFSWADDYEPTSDSDSEDESPHPTMYRPSKTRNWADDDDDFDFETWKATADTSAPTMDSLPPLQSDPTAEEPTFVVSRDQTSTESTPAATEPTQASEPTEQENETVVYFTGAQILAQRATQEQAVKPRYTKPAYPEMSNDGRHIVYSHRHNYSSNWQMMKANGGFDCRYLVQFKLSPLRQVMLVDEEDIVEERVANVHEDHVEMGEPADEPMMFSMDEQLDCDLEEYLAQEQECIDMEDYFDFQDEIDTGIESPELARETQNEEDSTLALETGEVEADVPPMANSTIASIDHDDQHYLVEQTTSAPQNSGHGKSSTHQQGSHNTPNTRPAMSATSDTDTGSLNELDSSSEADLTDDTSSTGATDPCSETGGHTSSCAPSTTTKPSTDTCILDQGSSHTEYIQPYPTLRISKVSFNTSLYSTQATLSPIPYALAVGTIVNYDCGSAINALMKITKGTKVCNDNAGPVEAADLISTNKGSDYIWNVAAASWTYVTSISYKAAAVVAAGIALGGAVHFARRR